jgi:hypothetical protein
MLMDALDGTLPPEDQATFDLHLLGCSACSGMLADAKRGTAWLEMLRDPRPEPSAELLERILAQTSGAAASAIADETLPAVAAPNTLLGQPAMVPLQVAQASAKVLPFRSRVACNIRNLGHTMLQPRLAMTAAMAFFSVALTLNLVGVRLSDISLRPSSIKRGFAQANAHVVRYYDNLRVVYELESRVHDLQTTSPEDTRPTNSAPALQPQQQQPAGDQDPAAQPDQQREPAKQPAPKSNNRGSSQREGPNNSLKYTVAYTASPKYYPVPLDESLPGLELSFTTRVREGRLG